MARADVEACELLELYRSMYTIRKFEEVVADLVEDGEVATPCHFCIGQEAVAAGVCGVLKAEDQIWGAHRSHGHYLAKGGSVQALMSEIYCRADGCSGGRGGSMHVCDPSVGIMGTVPIVAATIPIAAGAGLAAKMSGLDRISVSFFGDGATEEGHFHESLNFAAVAKLPVIFVCENNLYSSHMATFERRAKDAIPEFGEAHGIPSFRIDGNDVQLVVAATLDAVARAREGNGPTLLEFRTFRWRGHVGPSWDMDVGVKRKDELGEWLERDPIKRCAESLLSAGVDASEIEGVEDEVNIIVNSAVENARKAEAPASNTVGNYVYRAA